MAIHDKIKSKTLSILGASPLGNVGSQIGSFVKANPLLTGGSLAVTTLAGIGAVAFAKRKKKKSTKKKKKRNNSSRPSHRGVHKHRKKRALDVIHRGKKKRSISLKAIRGAIASPRTPPHLKKGLRKLLKKRASK